MFNNLHESLMEKGGIYSKWHESKLVPIIHFILLALVAGFFATTIQIGLTEVAYYNLQVLNLQTPVAKAATAIVEIIYDREKFNECWSDIAACKWVVPADVKHVTIETIGGGAGQPTKINCADGSTLDYNQKFFQRAYPGGGGAAYAKSEIDVNPGDVFYLQVGKRGSVDDAGSRSWFTDDLGIFYKNYGFAIHGYYKPPTPKTVVASGGGKINDLGLSYDVNAGGSIDNSIGNKNKQKGGDGGIGGQAYAYARGGCSLKPRDDAFGGGGGGAGGRKGDGQGGDAGKPNSKEYDPKDSFGGRGGGDGIIVGNGGKGGAPGAPGRDGEKWGGGGGGKGSNYGDQMGIGADGVVIITYTQLQ